MSSPKSCKIIAYFTIAPVGTKSTSIGNHVATAIEAIDKVKDLSYELTPMGTILEANNLEPILTAVKAAHDALTAEGILRIESTLIVDDRKDKPRTMKDKIDSVKKHIKQL